MAENILTSLSKIKTAIVNDNSENSQAPANLTDALSGIAGAITEQKGSGSGGTATGSGGGRVIEIKQNPNDSNDWSLTSPITWTELEQLIYNKVPISLAVTSSYTKYLKTFSGSTTWRTIILSQYRFISIQNENQKHIVHIDGIKKPEDDPNVTIYIVLVPSTNQNAETLQQYIIDFNKVNVYCQIEETI